jgi:Ca2+/Na+ antiporter
MTKIPNELNQKIMDHVRGKLHPNLTHLMLKFFIIHIIAGVFTLALCPQFGFTTFKLPFNLMNTFMVFGMAVCNFLCGVFFTATSVILSAFVLERDEVRALKYNKTLATLTIILTSFGFFSIMNPNVFLELSLLWLLGAVMGVIFTLEIGGRLLVRA